jgi:hypothetical protein
VLDITRVYNAPTASHVAGSTTMLQAGRNAIRIPVGGDFLVPKHVQTGPGAHSASASMGSEILSWRKAAGA